MRSGTVNSEQRPAISVCIANYNGRHVIERCVDSVLRQQCSADFEVIVFDDASADGSHTLVARRFPSIRLLSVSNNGGYCRANNAMADAARGDYLLLLNNDAWLEHGALEALWQAALAKPQAILSLRQLDAATGEVRDYGMGLDFLFVPFPLERARSAQLVSVMGACLWTPRALFFEARRFPEWFDSIAEDLYLCLFARFRSADVRLITTHSYYHHAGHSFGGGEQASRQLSTTYVRRRLSERNRFALLLSFLPSGLVLPLAAGVLFSWALESVALSATTRSLAPCRRIYLAALRDVWMRRQAIWELRCYVQGKRLTRFRDFLAPLRPTPVKLAFLLRHGVPRLRSPGHP